jgi:hypothetical protein
MFELAYKTDYWGCHDELEAIYGIAAIFLIRVLLFSIAGLICILMHMIFLCVYRWRLLFLSILGHLRHGVDRDMLFWASNLTLPAIIAITLILRGIALGVAADA